MRTAIVASMFGYALAGFSVLVDIGRYWNAYNFFVPGQWNGSSVMLEVGLCVMGYTVVLIIEFLPSVMEKLGEMKNEFIKKIALFFYSILDKILVFIVAIGITLPTMHQSSLGSLFIIAGDKLHPLWQTSFLPLLFVSNALMMGFAIVVFEASLSAVGFKRPYEREALDISRFIPYVATFWLVIRGISLITSGGIMHLFSSPFHTFWFALEIGLVVYAAIMFSTRFNPNLTPTKAFYTAMLFGLGGGIYRFNVYMIGYDPGLNWYAYFPTVPEFMLTFGLIALEICAYIILARLLNLLPKPHAAH
jgi:Ni/Fe-hydrogenase subunit HybB-like protein